MRALKSMLLMFVVVSSLGAGDATSVFAQTPTTPGAKNADPKTTTTSSSPPSSTSTPAKTSTPTATAPAAAAATSGTQDSPKALSLRQTLEILIQKNPQIARERLSIRQAEAGVTIAQGAFGFDLDLDLRLDRSSLSADMVVDASLINDATKSLTLPSVRLTGGFALTKRFELGTALSLEFQNWWEQKDRYIVADPTNPLGTQQSSTTLTLRLTQPLIRGAWLEVNMAPIRQAQERVKMSKQQTSWFVVQQVAQTALAYWSLVYAKRQLKIVEGALGLAERQLRDTNTLIQAGKLASLERYQVEDVVAKRKNEVVVAKQAVDQAQTSLAALLYMPRSSQLFPLDAPSGEASVPGVDELLKWADQYHPQLRVARSQQKIAEYSTVVSRNNLLPRLDLVGGFSFVGFGRSDNNQTEGSSIGGAYGSLFDPKSHSFYIGLQLRVNLDMRQVRNRWIQDDLEVQRAKLNLNYLTRELRLNIRKLYRDIARADLQIVGTKSSLHWAKKKLEAEQDKFSAGKSTLFQVLQFQQDLAVAQLAALLALINKRRAVIALLLQVGSLPQFYGIEKQK